MSSPLVHRFDVAIAGAGPAGAAAAIELARAGARVLLAGAPAPAVRIGEGLVPAARSLLRELGVLHAVWADGHRASPGTHAVWGDVQPQAHDHLFGVHGAGLQLDRARFDARLRQAALEAGAHLACPATLRPDDPPGPAGGTRLLRLQRPGAPAQAVQARWWIDATGRGAGLARRLGARRIQHDRLFAWHLRLRRDESPGEAESDLDGRTRVEAVPDGWWYSVLLPAGDRVLAFLGDGGPGDDPGAPRDADTLWRRLCRDTQMGAWCLRRGYRPQGRVRGAACGSVELDAAAGAGWYAVGDAAQAFDPLSSKGIGHALYTGLQAARTLQAEAAGERDAAARYAQHLRDIHRTYRTQLAAVYATETRWPDAPFWALRQRPPAVAPAG